MQISLEKAKNITNAQLIRPNGAFFNGVSYDNRMVQEGQLFIAIKGSKNDGHLFALDAVSKGASAVMGERDPLEGTSHHPLLLVKNSLDATVALGHYCRENFQGKVITITGTAGKTTTKELIRHILEINGKTAFTPKNKNTQLGVSASLLNFDGDEKYWVTEAGINHPDDMEELGALLEPDLAIILNVGLGHTLELGDKGTAYYKTRLLKYVKASGITLVSDDYDDLVSEAKQFKNVVFFSTNKSSNAPFKSEYLGRNANGYGQYRLFLDGVKLDVVCPFAGAYAAENLIAASAAAGVLGISTDEIRKGIDAYEQPEQRFRQYYKKGWTIIDDSYNANPLSSARMLEAAEELRGKPFVCVMGEMLELGEKAEEAHIQLGEKLAEVHCNDIYWVGNMGDAVYQGLKNGNFKGSFTQVGSPDNFTEFLKKKTDYLKAEHGVIIFKGSRGNRMERFLNIFENRVQ